jgi:hypothetical protein
MSIPVGLAKVAGRLRSGRVGHTAPKTYLAPLSKVLEYSGKYVDGLANRPHRRKSRSK